MTALTENPAVINPRGHLTRAQQDALCAIGFYRNQTKRGSKWIVGSKRFDTTTLRALKESGLLAGNGRGFWPTTAGQMAIDRLRGER